MLQEQLFEEIKAPHPGDRPQRAGRDGDWWYYTRTVEGQQYGIHCRAPIAGPDDWEPPVLPDESGGPDPRPRARRAGAAR